MSGSYNPWLVLLSVLVAVFAASVALDLGSRVVATRGRAVSHVWLAGGALSMGTGIWSMHFIGMLAFRLPVRMAYDMGLTVASLLVAVAASGLALSIIGRGTLGARVLLAGGVLMGLAIASMHYLGMAAMEVQSAIHYRPLLVLASCAIGIGASVLALWTAFQLRAQTIVSAFRKKAGNAAILGLGISGMHYTGMAAAVFPLQLVHAHGASGMSNTLLAGVVAGFTLLLLATTLLLSIVDAHFAARAAAHVADLRLVNAALARQAAELTSVNSRLQGEIEERVRSEARAHHLAFHDVLTGLPNRAMFSQLLSRQLDAGAGAGTGFALMFIDLDRFKTINDTLGHEAGDALLVEVAGRLQRSARGIDSVARLGGDEFVVLLPGLGDPPPLADVARALLATIVQPYAAMDQEFHVTASIGISLYPEDGEDERTLMRRADVAMYRAKADGKNNFRFYHRGLDAHAFERLAMEGSLRHALARDEFVLHYQPKVEAATGRITGVEALLRWRHPDQGLVLPGQFLPLAEEVGLTVPIGLWVLRTACRQHAAWRARGLPRLGMAVNLSARQFFDEHLLRDLAVILADHGMEPALLELEITEGTLMRDVDRALHTLAALGALGVQVALDGFGTGYASLGSLKRFPVNTIKVDRSFVRDLPGGAQDRSVADAVIAMGRALSMTVIAEGVETGEQADYLRGQACDQLQGYYFREAVPADDIEALLVNPTSAGTPAR